MTDQEERLRDMKRLDPSPQLDRRIDRLLSKSTQAPRTTFLLRRAVPLWSSAVAWTVALAAGLLLGRATAPADSDPSEAATLIYVFDGGDRVTGNTFDWSSQEHSFLESTAGLDTHVAVSQDPDSG